MRPVVVLNVLCVTWLLAGSCTFAADAAPPPLQFIQQVDLIHFSHTDYGFTDHPAVCRDMQRRYLNIALDAAVSPVWGPGSPSAQRTVDELTQDLCLFDEHTWGSSMSVALPYSLDTQAQWNEKARLAWKNHFSSTAWVSSCRCK